jgi:isoquinoline 1-oxidoreductase alpha subunit
MQTISFEVNGVQRTVVAEPDTPLLWLLRESLGLTGTKFGCGIGVCGACTVHRAGQAVRSCQVSAAEAASQSFTTIEGLSPDGSHPCQRAWIEEDVAQCGFCQAGLLMTAAALLARKARADEAEAALSEHVCRCGTYVRVRRAFTRAAALVKVGRREIEP